VNDRVVKRHLVRGRRLPQWTVHEYTDGTYAAVRVGGGTVSPRMTSFAKAAGWARQQDATWHPATSNTQEARTVMAASKKSTSKKSTATKTTAARKNTAAAKTTTARKNGAARKTTATARKTATVRVPAADVIGSFRLPPVFVDAAKLNGTVVKRNDRAVYVKMDAAAVKKAKAAADRIIADDNATTGEVISAHAALKAIAKGPRK